MSNIYCCTKSLDEKTLVCRSKTISYLAPWHTVQYSTQVCAQWHKLHYVYKSETAACNVGSKSVRRYYTMDIFSGTCSFVARHEQITRRININSYYWNLVHIMSQSCRENYFLLMTGPLDFYNIAWNKVQDMQYDATLPALLRVTCLTTSRSLRCAAKVFWVLDCHP